MTSFRVNVRLVPTLVTTVVVPLLLLWALLRSAPVYAGTNCIHAGTFTAVSGTGTCTHESASTTSLTTVRRGFAFHASEDKRCTAEIEFPFGAASAALTFNRFSFDTTGSAGGNAKWKICAVVVKDTQASRSFNGTPVCIDTGTIAVAAANIQKTITSGFSGTLTPKDNAGTPATCTVGACEGQKMFLYLDRDQTVASNSTDRMDFEELCYSY